MQPYFLFRDSRDQKVWRVAADAQSKRPTTGNALVVDQINLRDNYGVPEADLVVDADNSYLHVWLDSV